METKIKKEITEKEDELIELIRKEIPYGSFKIFTFAGQPARWQEAVKGRSFGVKKSG